MMTALFILGGIALIIYVIANSASGGTDAGTYNFEETDASLTPYAVVMDVETTGLINWDGAPTKAKLEEWDEGYPRIVQIAWITISREYKAVQRKAYVIKQSKPIPKDSIAIHGITDARAKNEGVDLKEVLMEFRRDVEECEYYVGHNVQFDKYVIEAECLRCKLAKPFVRKGKYDTMVMGKSLMGRKFFKLEDLARSSMPKEQFEELTFHDAEEDVYVTAALFCALHKHDIKY